MSLVTTPTQIVSAIVAAPAPRRWGLLELFALSQTVLPALLYLPGTQQLRVPIRVSAFAISIALLVYWALQVRKTTRPHPSRGWLIAAVIYVAAQLLHPTTNGVMVGLAQTMLYVAVTAPVFWVPDLLRDRRQLWRLLAILLVCNGVNAMVGILQVYDPDRWLPREFTLVDANRAGGPLGYTGPDGKKVIRPPGLSDNPGAVCGPAVAAAMLGMVFGIQSQLAMWRRAAALGFAFAGAAVIYLTHVRSSLIVLVASILMYGAILLFQKRRARAITLLIIATACLVSAFSLAVLLGGEEVTKRFASLIDEDARTVYYRSGRGRMVEQAFNELLEQYPLGAGLGRWGMTRVYFGDDQNHESPLIWAEVQWAAWMLDGGVVLVVCYTLALAVDILHCLRLARQHHAAELQSLAAAVLAANAGTLALLFSFVPFHAPVGVQYWFLAGALHGASSRRDEAAVTQSVAKGDRR